MARRLHSGAVCISTWRMARPLAIGTLSPGITMTQREDTMAKARAKRGTKKVAAKKAATTRGAAKPKARAEELNPLAIAREQLDNVAERLNLDQRVYERLRYPRRVLTVSIPTVMDDGTASVFTGYGCITTFSGDRPRVASASTRTSRWMR